MTLATGRFNRVVAWDEPIETRGDGGAYITDFVETFTTHTCIEPLRGRELLKAREILAEADTKLTIRHNPNTIRINAKWRARYNGIIYNAGYVGEVDMAHREIEILCTSGTNAG